MFSKEYCKKRGTKNYSMFLVNNKQVFGDASRCQNYHFRDQRGTVTSTSEGVVIIKIISPVSYEMKGMLV